MLIKRKPLDQPLSQKRLEANRRNALKSTGPASARGRAVSSQNARKYQLLPYENPELPAQLTAQYYGHFVPGTTSERRLVDIMVFSERILRNCALLESHVRAHELANREGRTRAEALAQAARRLTDLPQIRSSAEGSQSDALRQLEATRTKVEAKKPRAA